MNYFKKPDNLLLLTAILLLIVSLFYLNTTLDINFHDAYYVFPPAYILWAWIIMLLLYWGVYKIFRKTIWSNKLTWLHVLTTIIVFVFSYLITFHGFLRSEGGFWWGEAPREEHMKRYFSFAGMLVFAIAQAAFVVNIVAGLIKKMKTMSPPSSHRP